MASAGDDDPRARVAASVARLARHGVSCLLATSPRAHSLHRVYDTLVLRVLRDRPREDLSAPRAIRSDKAPAAQVIAEALRLWYRVSLCEGMAFHENFAFWVDALGAEMMRSVHPLAVPAASVAFPRVVLHWDFRANNGEHWRCVPIEDELELLHERVLDMFQAPEEDDEEEEEQEEPPSGAPAIQCFVRFRFRKQYTTNHALFYHMAAQAALYALTGRRSGDVLVWAGIEILGRHYHERRLEGLDNNDLKLLTNILAAVPSTMRVDLRLPQLKWENVPAPLRRRQVLSESLVPFVRQAYGFSPTKAFGHLKVLDLVSGFLSMQDEAVSRVDVASVCSLVPFTTSLEKLRVQITSNQDLLWLAYAVFHPRAAQTSWRTLVVHIPDGAQRQIDWRVWNTLFHARSRVAMLKDWPLTASSNVTEEEGSTWKWTTAIVLKRAKVYHSEDKQGHFLSLDAGDRVDVCDTSGSSDGDAATMVPVVVPGYCVGWIGRSKLSRIRSKEYAEPPTPSLTSLTIDDPEISPEEQETVLRLMGKSLQNLRTSGPDWFQRPDLHELLPNIELIDNCRFTPELVASDIASLAKLKTLELHCTVETLAACGDWMSRHRHFPALSELFLRIHEVGTFTVMPNISSALVGKHSLRRVTVILTHEHVRMMRHKMSENDPVSMVQRKLAFLSVLHHTEPGEAIASLDTSLVRLIFDYLGLSVAHLGVFVMPKRTLDDLLVRNDPETPGDGWYDT